MKLLTNPDYMPSMSTSACVTSGRLVPGSKMRKWQRRKVPTETRRSSAPPLCRTVRVSQSELGASQAVGATMRRSSSSGSNRPAAELVPRLSFDSSPSALPLPLSLAHTRSEGRGRVVVGQDA